MPPDPLASDDPIAQRRFAYAEAAGREGDWAAAAEVLEQTLERAPEWAAAWFALGEAREKLGQTQPARDAFGAALRLDPGDALGASARLALLGGSAASGLPPAYVARLFDQYAPRFDAHLTGALAYRGPGLIAGTLEAVAPGRRFAHGLDIGCGTGLAAVALAGRVAKLDGVDLSEGMIARAKSLGLYDRLVVGDALTMLRAAREGEYDLIVAADALVYFGDLAPIFAAARRALAADGWFVFTAEASEHEDFRLNATMRFSHSRAYLEREAREAGLPMTRLVATSSRREAGAEVSGWAGALSVARERAGSPR